MSPARPLRLALLGCDDDVLGLVRAIRDSRVAECVAAFDVDAGPAGSRREVASAFPDARLDEPWENWLTRGDLDAVVVAGMSPAPEESTDKSASSAAAREARIDQIKKLVQGQIPLLVSHPCGAGIDALEIEMMRADAKSVVVPAESRCRRPAIDQLAARVSRKGDPPVARVVMTRRLPRRNRTDVLRWFARDLETLKRLVGRVVKISAAGPATPTGEDVFSRPDRSPSLSELVAHVQGENGIVARWSVEPSGVGEAPAATLRASWEAGDWRIEMPEDAAWTSNEDGRETVHPMFDPWLVSVETLRKALAGEATEPSWVETARGLDVAGSVDRALTRGRAVEFFNEELSEQASFKAVMSVWGCLILMVTLIGLIATAVAWQMLVGRIEVEPREDGQSTDAGPWRWAQLCVVAPLAAFLLAQLLLWGLKQRDENRPGAGTSS